MSVLVGVDAGGSHTEALAADDSLRPLGRRRGGPGAMTPGAASQVAHTIAAIIRGALEEANLARNADAVAVGAAGAGREPERAALELALAEQLGGVTKLTVTTDAAIALQAAFQDGSGIVVNAGSGSIAYACDRTGKVWRVGGLGWQLGDEGSGYALVRAALGIVGRAADGRGPRTALSGRLAAAVGADSLDELVRWTQTAPHTAVAALAGDVCDVAHEGDQPAQELVRRAADDLAAHVAALLGRFPKESRVQVALCGGLLRPDSPVRAAVAELLGRDMPRVHLMDAAVDPPMGAAALAARLLEHSDNQGWLGQEKRP